MTRKQFIILMVSLLAISILMGVIEYKHYDQDYSSLGLTFGITTVLFYPAIIILLLYGLTRIVVHLVSSNVSSASKKEMVKRILIVIGVSAAVIAIWAAPAITEWLMR